MSKKFDKLLEDKPVTKEKWIGVKDKKRINVDVEEDVYYKFDMKCRTNRTKMASVIREFVEKYTNE